jgi:hypothetical protein
MQPVTVDLAAARRRRPSHSGSDSEGFETASEGRTPGSEHGGGPHRAQSPGHRDGHESDSSGHASTGFNSARRIENGGVPSNHGSDNESDDATMRTAASGHGFTHHAQKVGKAIRKGAKATYDNKLVRKLVFKRYELAPSDPLLYEQFVPVATTLTTGTVMTPIVSKAIEKSAGTRRSYPRSWNSRHLARAVRKGEYDPEQESARENEEDENDLDHLDWLRKMNTIRL